MAFKHNGRTTGKQTNCKQEGMCDYVKLACNNRKEREETERNEKKTEKKSKDIEFPLFELLFMIGGWF